MSSSYRLELDKWLSSLDVKAESIMDIGGSQLPVKGRTHSWDVKEYKIADLEYPHVNSPKPDFVVDMNAKNIKEELAYIAGIVDGEGCISVTRKGNTKNYYPSFGMNMMTEEAFMIIERVFGFGKTRYFTQKPTGKKFYGLQLTGNDLTVFLQVIKPYLRVKKKQALLALQLRNDIDLFRRKFVINPMGGFSGSESHEQSTIERRKRIYETMKLFNHYHEYFDMLFCLEVAEYWFDPVNAFDTLTHFMKPGGRAYVTFPFFYPTHQPIEDDALRYTEFGIRKLANFANLTIVNITPRRPETNTLLNFFSAERMRAAKNYDHEVTGWIVELEK